jgi:D-threonate/D-erythronate kinase
MDRTLVVADDLTGAAELAAFVGTPERPARVAWTDHSAGSEATASADSVRDAAAPSIVIDTESRNLPARDARARLAGVVRDLPPTALTGVVYKKIDSTLRGPIRAEITLLHELVGLGPVIAAPAYPRMGRTTVGAVQYLNDVPVADGPAGDDPVAAARVSDVTRLLPPGDHTIMGAPGDREVAALASELESHRRAGRHVVVDAEREADLERLAEALRSLPPSLLMGTGGLARHLWSSRAPVAAPRGVGRIVVIVGSHHPAAREQAAQLERTRAFRYDGAVRDETASGHRDEVLVLTTPSHRIEPEAALRDLEHTLEEVIALGVARAVVVTGGESALHVLKRVGASSLDVMGELVDGVPIGIIVGGPWAGTILATKAGGFGGPDVLVRAVGRLSERMPESA